MQKYGLMVLALLLWATPGWARLPTEADYETLKTDITVTFAAEFAGAIAATDDQSIAAAYNVQAVPDCWVYRTVLLLRELYEETSVDGTTWDWTTYISQSGAEKAAWEQMFFTQQVNPSKPNVQSAVNKIFSGAGASVTAQRAHFAALSRRKARRIERLLASGACTTAQPSTMSFEGTLSYWDVAHALRGVPLP